MKRHKLEAADAPATTWGTATPSTIGTTALGEITVESPSLSLASATSMSGPQEPYPGSQATAQELMTNQERRLIERQESNLHEHVDAAISRDPTGTATFWILLGVCTLLSKAADLRKGTVANGIGTEAADSEDDTAPNFNPSTNDDANVDMTIQAYTANPRPIHVDAEIYRDPTDKYTCCILLGVSILLVSIILAVARPPIEAAGAVPPFPPLPHWLPQPNRPPFLTQSKCCNQSLTSWSHQNMTLPTMNQHSIGSL
jgi:hypothetical protein